MTIALEPTPASARRSRFQHRRVQIAELVGVFRSLRQQWEDTKLIELEARDESTGRGIVVKVDDPDNELRPELTYRFHGRWHEHHKWGRQFLAETFTTDTPINHTGVVAYLSETCDHVGRATAQKLWDKFGQNAIEVLRDTPQLVVEAEILKPDQATEAADCLKHDTGMQRTKIELLGMFKGRGFGKRCIAEAVKQWGARAGEVVRRDPFKLMVSGVPGASFKRCDDLYMTIGLPPKRLKRQCLAAWYELHSDSNGHTWFPMGKMAKTDPKAIELGIRAKWLTQRKDDKGKLWITESTKATAEEMLAEGLRRLLAWQPILGDQGHLLWPSVEALEGISDHQRFELGKALSAPVAVLAGTPGTGKTYCAAKVIKAIIHQFGRQNVVVCAPTGKAAVRIQENFAANGVTLQATTVHRLLKMTPDTPVDAELPTVSARFVVVDETSMADVPLVAVLLACLQPGTHVLFIGDPYQLPPVGHGAPLRDMIESGVIPVGELTEIRRNAGTIVQACKAIKDGQEFPVAEKYNPETGDNLRFIESCDPDDTVAGVVKLHEVIPRYGFDPSWDAQVLVAMNERGPCARVELNTLLQNHLNRDGFKVDGNTFRVGDKIICTRNSTMRLVRYQKEFMGRDKDPRLAESYQNLVEGHDEKVEDYVANGEIGRVLAVGQKQTIAKFEAPVRLVRILHGTKNEGEDGASGSESSGTHFDLAYAITTHKSQGSEWPCVIIVVDPAAKMICTKEHVYTSISRAKKLCLMVGERRVADGFCRRTALNKRKTFLKERLK